MMTDEEREVAREKRLRLKFEKLGFMNPRCVICGKDDVRCLELHHVAGRCHSGDVCPVCRNCHAILTDLQTDHPRKEAPPDNVLEIIGRLLLGVADLFELLVSRFREYGETLIRMATGAMA
jgi:hypothetical protein